MQLVPAPDTSELRKARGAFFTPPEVAEYIAAWAIRSPDDVVLEPSCGEAEFLLAAGRRLDQLGAPRRGRRSLRGVELHEPSAAAAQQLVQSAGLRAEIHIGDFFEAPLSRGSFAAVVGNPPYVRYQGFTGEARARAQRAALAAGVSLSGLASSWAAFAVHSAELLRPDGRLGLVLPAELLTTNYAGPVRRYLLNRFKSVRLIMFDERVFPGVLAEIVLLLAEGSGGTDTVDICQARNFASLDCPPILRWAPPDPSGKWSSALLPADVLGLYSDVLDSGDVVPLSGWGETDLVAVTGNNRYFCLSSGEARAAALERRELTPISPPGSRHLRGLGLSCATWRELERGGRKVWLFSPEHHPSDAALTYIAAGEAAEVHEAYKCRVRSPWWKVPQLAPPDLFVTYMNADSPRIVANEAQVTYLNSVHGVRVEPSLRDLARRLLPIAALNSATILGAELVGRSYGGGILKLEPKEADLLPVPAPALVRRCDAALSALRPVLAEHLRQGDLLGASEKVDRVLLRSGMGVRQLDLKALREARAMLHDRRKTRGRR